MLNLAYSSIVAFHNYNYDSQSRVQGNVAAELKNFALDGDI